MNRRGGRKPSGNAPEPRGTIDRHTLEKLSNLRRAEIHSSMGKTENPEDGIFAHSAVAHSPGFRKTAMMGNPVLPTTTSHTDRLAPDIYSPLFQLANLNLPRDRVTMNAWNRIFYDTHPIVRNAINLHASYPISKINITCKSQKVQEFFLEMAERIDLYSIVYGVSLEFWKMGESFPYAELDRRTGMWKRVTILNPDYVHVKKPAVGDQTIISLRPDASLQRLVNSSSPTDLKMKRRIPQYILDYVKKGQNIPLDALNVSHLKLLSSPYDVRGTSIIVSIYKDLMLYDKLRESKFAQADGMVNPLTLVKLGGSNDYRPTQSDIDAFRTILEEAQYDKDFKIVTHEGVTIERVGFSGAVLDVAADIELINNNIYTGLMTPKALMDQEGVTYASSSVGLEVLRQRYDIFRNMMKKWLEQKIFAPICEIQGFFEYVDGEKRLVVPQVDFNHMNLYDMNDYIQNISNFVTNNQVSLQTLYRSLGLSKEEEDRRLKEELIANVIRQKEEQAMQAMRLAELRNLDADSAITEPPDQEIPGMEAGPGGEDMGGLPGVGGPGGGGLDLGGLPPMPGGEGGGPEGGLDLGGPPEGGPLGGEAPPA
nr:hypothetical protein 54 [bacterium]